MTVQGWKLLGWLALSVASIALYCWADYMQTAVIVEDVLERRKAGKSK